MLRAGQSSYDYRRETGRVRDPRIRWGSCDGARGLRSSEAILHCQEFLGNFRGYGGYLRLSYDYMRTYGKYGYYINEVHPVDAQTGQCRQDVTRLPAPIAQQMAGLGKGKCKTKKAKGKACLSWRQCKSGRCVVGICRDPYDCTKTEQCKKGQYCKLAKLEAKTPAKTQAQWQNLRDQQTMQFGALRWWKPG